MDIEDPPHLFKYSGMGSPAALQRLCDMLTNHRLWFPRPIDFNDSFDCAPSVQITLPLDDIRATPLAERTAASGIDGNHDERRKRGRIAVLFIGFARDHAVEGQALAAQDY